MALTGLVLVLFVLGHMLGNLQIFLGADVINAYAYKLHHLLPHSFARLQVIDAEASNRAAAVVAMVLIVTLLANFMQVCPSLLTRAVVRAAVAHSRPVHACTAGIGCGMEFAVIRVPPPRARALRVLHSRVYRCGVALTLEGPRDALPRTARPFTYAEGADGVVAVSREHPGPCHRLRLVAAPVLGCCPARQGL